MTMEHLNNQLLCDAAQRNHRTAALWLNLWNTLVFVIGCIFVAFVAAIIFTLLDGRETAAAIAGAATVADGAVALFVVKQRAGMKKEERAAYDDVKTACAEHSPSDRLLKNLGMKP